MGPDRGRRLPLQLVAFGHVAQVAGLVDEGPPDECRMSERQLERDDAARAASEHDHVAQAEAIQQRRSVVGVLGRSGSGPILPAAPQRPPSIVGHDGMPGEPLGHGPPALRVLGATRDQQDRRPGAAGLDVERRPVDTRALDPRWGGRGDRFGIGA